MFNTKRSCFRQTVIEKFVNHHFLMEVSKIFVLSEQFDQKTESQICLYVYSTQSELSDSSLTFN